MTDYKVPVFGRLKKMPEPAKPKRAPKVEKPGRRISDADVVAMRHMHQVDGFSRKEVLLAFPHVSTAQAYKILSGQSRKGVTPC